MEDKKNNFENLNFIKICMAMIVVLIHCCRLYDNSWFELPAIPSAYLGKFGTFLDLFAVQTFTMVSGYLYFYKQATRSYKNIKEVIKKRFIRLIVPYIFISLFWVIPFVYIFWNITVKEIIVDYVFCYNPHQLWFLVMLFWVFCIFEIFLKKVKFTKKNLVLFYFISTFLGYGVGFVLDKFEMNYFQLFRSIRFTFYFYLGGYILNNKDKINLKHLIYSFLCCIILYIFNIYLENSDNLVIYALTRFINTLFSGFACFIIYFICTKIINNGLINHNSKSYLILKKYNFGIYLFHEQFIFICIALFNGILQPIVFVIVSFFISIMCSLMLCYILSKNKYTARILGV